jgi:AraC-like DNA-binding protein
MTLSSSVDLHIRSYGQDRSADRHDYAQLVLPLSGAVALEIDGRQGVLDPLRVAFVAPGAWHSQCGAAGNSSIIVDLAVDAIAPQVGERLHEHPFIALGAEARKLVEFMGLMAGRGAVAPATVAAWAPLLLDTLVLGQARAPSRLGALLAAIELDPGQPWHTEAMARRAGLSASRLHALFRAEFDTTPHDWLLQLRLSRVCEWLATGTAPVAELALRAGFSDQSALTRAMRRSLGVTPAAYRRQRRENRPKTQ